MRLAQPATSPSASRLRRRAVLAACAVLAAAAPAAAAVASASAASAGRTQLIGRADKICRRVNTQTAPFQAQVTRLVSVKHPSYKRVATELDKGVAIEVAGLSQLRSLPWAAADRAAVTKVWNELGAIVADTHAMSRAIGAKNISALNEATQRKAGAQTVYRRLAKGFGFKYCGS